MVTLSRRRRLTKELVIPVPTLKERREAEEDVDLLISGKIKRKRLGF